VESVNRFKNQDSCEGDQITWIKPIDIQFGYCYGVRPTGFGLGLISKTYSLIFIMLSAIFPAIMRY